MATTQYIGARYVPMFSDPLDWDSAKAYEPLTIVYYLGNSYTSRQSVPAGIDIANTDYWALTGNYNAQIEAYRKEVQAYDGRITENAQAIADEVTRAVAEEAAIKELITAETTRAKAAESELATGVSNALTRIDEETERAEKAEGVLTESVAAAEKKADEVYTTVNTAADGAKYEGYYDNDCNCYVHILTLPKAKYPDFPKFNMRIGDNAYEFIKSSSYFASTYLLNGPLAGVLIEDGVVVNDLNQGSTSEYWYILGTDKNGAIKVQADTSHTVTAAQAVSAGFYNAMGIWHPIIQSGTAFSPSSLPTSEENYTYIITRKHPRSILAYDDENWYFVAVEGRIYRSEGINFEQELALCRKLGFNNAYNLDGGHSVQAWSVSPTFNFVRLNSASTTYGYSSGQIFAFMRFEEGN